MKLSEQTSGVEVYYHCARCNKDLMIFLGNKVISFR